MKWLLLFGAIGLVVFIIIRKGMSNPNGNIFVNPRNNAQSAAAQAAGVNVWAVPPTKAGSQNPTTPKGSGPSICEQVLDAGASAYAKGAGNIGAVQKVHKAECYIYVDNPIVQKGVVAPAKAVYKWAKGIF